MFWDSPLRSNLSALLFFALVTLIVKVTSRPVGGSDSWSDDHPSFRGFGEASSSNPDFNWQDEHTLQSWSPNAFGPSSWHYQSPAAALGTSSSSQPWYEQQQPVIDVESSPSQKLQQAPQLGRSAAPSGQVNLHYKPPILGSEAQAEPAPNKGPDQFASPEQLRTDWEASMRRALGNPHLVFIPVETRPHPAALSRVFVAQHATDLNDHHPPTALLSTDQNPIWASHFTGLIGKVKKVETKTIYIGKSNERMFVYLNSEYNMQYLNREYFLDRLTFFPINPKELSWTMLTNMFKARKHVLILPPRTEPYGLPLLIARHDPGTEWMNTLRSVTGDFVDERQVVSLWSPVLYQRDRTTLVLYGVARLNQVGDSKALLHIEKMAKEWSDKPLAAAYYLKDHFPNGYLPE